MRIGLRLALIMLVMGVGCIFSGEVSAAAKPAANKSVMKKPAFCAKKKNITTINKTVTINKTATINKTVKTAKIANKPQTAKFAKRKKAVDVAEIVKPVAAKPARCPATLSVQSGAALVVEQDAGGAVLYQKNADQIVPIASITKLMTAMVVLDGSPSLEAPITITDDDVDYLRGSRSRLPVGSVISRRTALLLALMSSENRAAHALARHSPGGMPAFLTAMNTKAKELGMTDSRFEDPTGLNSGNVSTAIDLAKMVSAAHRYQLIRELTTTAEAKIDLAGKDTEYHNTNPLVRSAAWEVGVSKTGYINEAGRCLVMQARLAEKPVVIVLLDSQGSMTRVGDANRIKQWMDTRYNPPKVAVQTISPQKRGRDRS